MQPPDHPQAASPDQRKQDHNYDNEGHGHHGPGNPIDYLVAHTPEFRGNKAIFNAPKVWLGDLLGYKICDDDQ